MLSIIFNVIVAEFEYLSISLKKIMNTIHVSENGEIHISTYKINSKLYKNLFPVNENQEAIHNKNEIKKVMNLTRMRLKVWIQHHAKVTR